MSLHRLLITDFRNIAQAQLDFTPTFNFLIGENGSGKTSVLEAIYALGHGRSFRSLYTERVIRHGQSAFTLHGRFLDGEREVAMGLMKSRTGEVTVRIDGTDDHKTAELARLMPMQLITPEGFTLLSGGPKYRRAYLDWGCFHHTPEFYSNWNQFRRLLKQRNAALRQAFQYKEMVIWDKILVPIAEKISDWRAQYSDAIANTMMATCAAFLPDCEISVTYQRGWDKERDYAQCLEQQFSRDRELTYTANGPHKADFRIRALGMPVEDILSRGQLKLLVCALRLAQGEFLSQEYGRTCFYLIDDFASELDEKRRHLLSERLKATQAQVFISAISAEHIMDMMNEKSRMLQVKKGKIFVLN